jgi:hypothetical protein
MPISRSQSFVPKVLPAGKLRTAIARAFEASGREPPVKLTISRKLPDGSESKQDVDPARLDEVCDLREPGLSVTTSSGPLGSWYYLGVHGGESSASVNAEAPDGAGTESLIETFLREAELDKPQPPSIDAGTDEATFQVEVSTPRVLTPLPTRLRSFVSYRLGPENESIALYVERLLGVLDVEVVTARSYEPRSIASKVTDRLRGIDLVVLIVGSDGESAWTRDEIATARASSASVVPLVVTGSTFEPGLFGDLEYIRFEPGHPGDAAVPLTEAIAFIRRTKDAGTTST